MRPAAQVSDQATRRPLGTSYLTSTPEIGLGGLPYSTPLEVAVQVRLDGLGFGA